MKRSLNQLCTLVIDIGGTGLKTMVLDAGGKAIGAREKVATPQPATPKAVLHALDALIARSKSSDFNRVSVGFPGVVVDDVVRTAPNLGKGWKDFPLGATLARRTRCKVRVLNDAGVQGYGVIAGRGVEMVLTFGTGLGCALFVDGHYVPNLELAHHPFHKQATYEDYVGKAALDAVGKHRWNKRVAQVVAVVLPIFNPRVLYLGGGNSKKLTIALPSNVQIVENIAGLLGGIALWKHSVG
ncbi:MAG: ROK family protein [Polyangiales bacterium]